MSLWRLRGLSALLFIQVHKIICFIYSVQGRQKCRRSKCLYRNLYDPKLLVYDYMIIMFHYITIYKAVHS